MLLRCHLGRSTMAILLFISSCISLAASAMLPVHSGTPVSIKDIFIGRCYEYQQVVRPDLFTSGTKNCTDMWMKFHSAFAFKSACSVQPEDYASYIAASDHQIETKDKVMYWSGQVYPLVVDFASDGRRYTIIRDLLAAYVINNILNWCGQADSPGINHKSCPGWGECPLLATTSYWKALSKNFASKIQGKVHLMLNGSNNNAYSNSSIFAQSELKNLDASRTPILHVHVAYNINGPISERCNTGSLLHLKKDVEDKKMKFVCTDDDRDLLFFQCASNPEASRCPKDPASLSSLTRPVYNSASSTALYGQCLLVWTLLVSPMRIF